MRRTGSKLLLVMMFLSSVCVSANEKDTSTNKNILILFAFSPSTPAYQIISDGIRIRLAEAFGDSFTLHSEYLETERYPQDGYPQERFDVYNEKYKSVHLNLLICIGIDIVPTIKKHASFQLVQIPAIVVDFDFTESDYPIETRLNDKTAVVQFRVNARKAISTALGLFPGTESVYFFSGVAKSDRLMFSLAQKASEKLDSGIQVHLFNDISMDEVLQTVRDLPGNSLVIVPSFTVDNKQVTYFNPEAIRLISKVAKAPVFTFTNMGFGEGAIGGYLLSYNKVGLRAGETAVNILKGIDPQSFIFTEENFYEFVFDARKLQQWNLTGSRLLPEECEIKFEEVSFFGRYKLYITAGILFILLQTLMIISLVRLNGKQKRVTNQLIESENRFRELIREDRILRLSQLTASLSHELNQPLTAILSTAQAGIRFIDSNNQDAELMKELFSNIAEDDKRTAAILSSIRGMMKLEIREKERINLNLLIEEILEIHKSEFVNNRIKLNKILAEPSVCIIADGVQIKQVIMNLITNAIQSIDKSSKADRQIMVREEVTDGQVSVFISDTGDGIPNHILEKIFTPFLTSKKSGTGIGLAISRSIIEDHQGRIWAENNPGRGATFAFSLNTC